MSNRKETTKYILNSIKISKTTYDIVSKLFENMSDVEFQEFMTRLKDKKINLSFVVPHEEKHTEDKLFEWLESIGGRPFQQLTYVENGKRFTAPNSTLILDIPIKRASQTQDKKVSIPTGNRINSLTGQVTGDSLTAQFTNPEKLLHLGFGATKGTFELTNMRSGDLGLGNAMDKALFTHGRVSMEDIREYSTKNVATKTFKAYLLASHIKSTL